MRAATMGRSDASRLPHQPPLVSIVITCYRQAQFLADAIASAQGQTHDNVEVIVVDDGSPDNTAEVAARFPDVQLLRRSNGGLPAARNTGLAAARGDYVVFLDADDVLRPEAVDVGVREFAADPDVAFVAGAYVLVDERRRPVVDQPVPLGVDDDAYLSFLRWNPIGMHAAVLYRREVVVAAGGFDTTFRACEDYDLYLRLTRAAPIRLHDSVIAEYRRHAENMSHDNTLMLTEALHALRKQRPHVVGSSARLAAYDAGRRGWLDRYFGPAVRDLHTAPTARAALSRAWRILRATGGSTVAIGLRSLRRRVVRALPRALGPHLRRRLGVTPPVGAVGMGEIRRTEPVSNEFGFDRGRPVDRYYIERFLAQHAADVRGHVLEIGDATYTRRFGGDDVHASDVLHVSVDSREATLVGDLADGDHLPSNAFDCIILTQTLHLIYDVRAALATAVRMLTPGGTLLVTVPGISQIDRGEWGATWSWAMTPYALDRLLHDSCAAGDIQVDAYGNVLAATAFLHGLADVELQPQELDHHDPAYPVLVTGRLVRP